MNTPEREQLKHDLKKVIIWHDGGKFPDQHLTVKKILNITDKDKHQALREFADRIKYYSDGEAKKAPGMPAARYKRLNDYVDKTLNQMIGGKE